MLTAGDPGLQGDADAIVTVVVGLPIAVRTADCGPVALASSAGTPVVAVAHAGWKGVAAGVVQATAARMRELGGTDLVAAVGPCIHPCCYEFGADDLDAVAAALGDGVRATTDAGAPALDVPAAVRAALAQAGVELVAEDPTCTACDAEGSFSHRARRETERQACVAWL